MSEFDDPFDLAAQSRPSGMRTPDGHEIRLVGRPILALDSATNDLLPLREFLDHPLVAGSYFYTLPAALWSSIIAEVGERPFDQEMLGLESAISTACGDHSLRVGVHANSFVIYQGLRSLPAIELSDDQWRAIGMEPAAGRHAARVRDAQGLNRFQRGYKGWLLTNPQFLDEHDQLFSEHIDGMRKWGTARASLIQPLDSGLPGPAPDQDPNWSAFEAASNLFCARWRLASLAGPYLPDPLQALMAGCFPLSVIQTLMRAGGVFYLPDTMPIPSRDQLRGLLDDALHRGERPEHLTKWFEMIRSGNSARNQLDRFGRLFEVQHYWRILFQRHATAVDGNVIRLEAAFADFFGLSPNSIHADLIAVRQRLGPDWVARSSIGVAIAPPRVRGE